ncbi:hypothetical protein Ancab_017939 [Ancistrocladus abbreviatus]
MISQKEIKKMSTFHNPSLERRGKTPSFSSILLDSIYRSIDQVHDSTNHHHEDFNGYSHSNSFFPSASRDASSMKKNNFAFGERTINLRRAIMIENWMEKQREQEHNQQHASGEKARIVRQKSVPANGKFSNCDRNGSGFFFGSAASASGSSESSSGGENYFSSSKRTADFSACFSPHKKPAKIRTTNFTPPLVERSLENCLHFEHASKHQGRLFTKSKLRALKIYGDMKRVKQPISPGGRIASFLNSIFNGKKTNAVAFSEMRTERSSASSTPAVAMANSSSSTCSSASSFSRSCMSKTPSSASRSIVDNGVKRSVRFCPVSIIVGEDSRPCGHKSLYEEDDPQLMPSIDARKSSRVTSKCRGEKEDIDSGMGEMMMRSKFSYQKNKTGKVEFSDEEMEEDDDEAESYASSDLFELENLSSIGIGRYNEELPVYGTTSLEKDQAIAKGFIF